MPYLTPDEIPEDGFCRPLSIPDNPAWLAIVSGALTELTKPWNWEQFGAVTVDQAIAAMQLMIDAYYDGDCAYCETPGGYRVIRINSEGHIEELLDGTWQAPTGDYYIPPPGAREEPTEQERKCLAAANAVNVLHLLYESLSDSWGEDLDENQAMLALVGVFAGIVGFAIAPISWGIYAIVAWIFTTMFGMLEILIADLWDEAVSDQIECFLYQCANDDAGVITFDYQCFVEKLSSLANDFSLTETQLRLYLQITYLLQFIGGVDGLNLAGATTAITEADCDDCEDCADYFDTMVSELGEKTFIGTSDPGDISQLPTFPGTYGTYISSGGVNSGEGYVEGIDLPSTYNRVVLVVDLGQECTFDGASIGWYHDSFGVSTNFIMLYDGSGTYVNHNSQDSISAVGSWVTMDWVSGSESGVRYIQFFADVTPGTVVRLGSFQVYTSP